MKQIICFAMLLSALALQGCSLFTVSDAYGNTYGSFADHGNQYLWQLASCEGDAGLVTAAPPDRKRWMQCCMWRHGVPIDDSTGCTAPPNYNG